MCSQRRPQSVVVRLVELSEHADSLSRSADEAERVLAACRETMSGRGPEVELAVTMALKSRAVEDARAAFDQVLSSSQRLRSQANVAQRIASACKAAVDMLPDSAVLEVLVPKVDGLALDDVRSRRRAVCEEIRILDSAPVPGPDLEARITAYVRDLARSARPYVRGIGAGQQLEVLWPSHGECNRKNLNGFSDHQASVLMLMAALFPRELGELILGSVEADTSEPLPVGERPQRMAQLRAEIDVMWRLLAALIEAAGEPHDPQCPPWAILGVREVEATQQVA